MANTMYDNNANMTTETLQNFPRTPIHQYPGFDLHINGIYDVILYLCKLVFLSRTTIISLESFVSNVPCLDSKDFFCVYMFCIVI